MDFMPQLILGFLLTAVSCQHANDIAINKSVNYSTTSALLPQSNGTTNQAKSHYEGTKEKEAETSLNHTVISPVSRYAIVDEKLKISSNLAPHVERVEHNNSVLMALKLIKSEPYKKVNSSNSLTTPDQMVGDINRQREAIFGTKRDQVIKPNSLTDGTVKIKVPESEVEVLDHVNNSLSAINTPNAIALPPNQMSGMNVAVAAALPNTTALEEYRIVARNESVRSKIADKKVEPMSTFLSKNTTPNINVANASNSLNNYTNNSSISDITTTIINSSTTIVPINQPKSNQSNIISKAASNGTNPAIPVIVRTLSSAPTTTTTLGTTELFQTTTVDVIDTEPMEITSTAQTISTTTTSETSFEQSTTTSNPTALEETTLKPETSTTYMASTSQPINVDVTTEIPLGSVESEESTTTVISDISTTLRSQITNATTRGIYVKPTENVITTTPIPFSGTSKKYIPYPITEATVNIDERRSTAANRHANTSTVDIITIPTEGFDNGKIAAIAISAIGGVCLCLLACLLLVMKKRQKRFNYGQRCRPVSLDDYSLDNISVQNSVRRKGGMRISKRSYGNPAFDDPSASVSHEMKFVELLRFANNANEIGMEFEKIPQISVRMNELPDGCDINNRYANVIPLPETRVQLRSIDGYPNSDYINANFVTGPKNMTGYYIACQAPMENTVDDFWRMVWEQDCKVILMITHLFENQVEKCFDYMPPSEVLDCHRLFGEFQITLKKREVKEKYIISSLQLKNMVSNSWRDITHFWYLGWPDVGVPREANSLIAFLIEARSYMKSASLERRSASMIGGCNISQEDRQCNSVVVHCSPGTGRTGVVIACDIAIRDFEQTRTVDIPKIVYKCRRGRAGAVQTKEQYNFIYKVISLYASKLSGSGLDSI